MSYVVLTAAVVVRVFGPTIVSDYRLTVLAAGGLSAVAFLLFLADYAPILCRARADGRPG
jgi:uncharacterized protein involved in response to NO